MLDSAELLLRRPRVVAAVVVADSSASHIAESKPNPVEQSLRHFEYHSQHPGLACSVLLGAMGNASNSQIEVDLVGAVAADGGVGAGPRAGARFQGVVRE